MANFDRYLQLPLFQGINKQTLTEFLDKIIFNFENYNVDEEICKQGEVCNKLIFVLSGSLYKQTDSVDGKFQIIETISSESLLEPAYLFGLDTYFHANYIAKEPCTLLIIDKQHLLSHLLNNNIFRLNYVNMLSSKVQQQQKLLWTTAVDNSINESFKRFILHHCENLTHPITIKISMPDLALYLKETRLSISKMLNSFEKRGLLILKRKNIIIDNPELLLDNLS